MAENEGARRDGDFTVVCLAPCVCKTPPDGKPVPYQISASLKDALKESANVKFRGMPAITKKARVSKVTGNEAGAAGGVKSNVNVGFCKPINGSSTVNVNGSNVLYHKDTLFEMNCSGPDGSGNTVGTLKFSGQSSPAQISPDGSTPPTDPAIVPETPQEAGFLEKIGNNLFSTDSVAELAQQAPDLATMDFSNPAAALGALSGVAGMAGLASAAQMAGMASKGYSLSKADFSNPAAMFGAVGLAAGVGGIAGGGPAMGALGAVAGAGENISNIAQADFSNPGSIMGVSMNAAGLCRLAG